MRDRIAAMRAASATSLRTLMQRLVVLAVVAVFALAPLVANVWPAFGRGAMLYTGDVAAAEVDHSAHEGHHAAASDSQHAPPHHQVHCALCMLALLGWAPPIDLGLGCAEARVIDRAQHLVANAPRPLLLWPDAQARAPPLS
jgi:hypothetical protein